jgi:hypothetical protein
MQGRIDTSFQTLQRDLFASGLAAEIGPNAFVTWLAIKNHADFENGMAWPGMRRLAVLTGLPLSSISAAVQKLLAHHLVRVVTPSKGKGRRGQTYLACERLDVRLGDRVLCTIVLDYVPSKLRGHLSRIDQALRTADGVSEILAGCTILPGPGFVWDAAAGVLRAQLPARDIPHVEPLTDEQLEAPLVQRMLSIADRVRSGAV